MSTDRCYARGCDHNNPDCTCMYGNKYMPCRIHCDNCVKTCKKTEGDIACKKIIKKPKMESV